MTTPPSSPLDHAVPLPDPEERLTEQEGWIRRLQNVTAAISGAAGAAEIADVVIAQGTAATGADGGVLALVDARAGELEIVGEAGHRPGGLDPRHRIPLDADLPLTAVVRNGTPIWGESTRSLADRFDEVEAVSRGAFGVERTVVVVPLVTVAGPIGSMAFGFSAATILSLGQQEFLLALSGQAALALERARLYEAERKARRAAEEAESRLAFLSRVSEVLSATLEPDEALDRLANLVVPTIAELCAIEVVEPDGGVRSVAIVHADAGKAAEARDARRRHGPSRAGFRRVIETGTSVVVAELDESSVATLVNDEDHLRAIASLGLSSATIVPVRIGPSVVGAIGLFGTGDRRFDDNDLAFAEEIARRASGALENGRLHEAERRARRESEMVVDWLSRLQSVTSSLSRAMTQSEVAEVVVREGLAALRADAGSIWVLEPDDHLRALAWQGYPDELAPEGARTPLGRGGPLDDAVSTREIVTVETPAAMVARWPQLAAMRDKVGDVATAATPLLLDDRVLGVLYVAFRADHAFGDQELAFLTTVARQCAQAFERARLYELERSRVDAEREAHGAAEAARMRLQQLQAITEAGLAHLGLDDALERMLAGLRGAIGSDTAAILLVQDDTSLRVRAALGVEGRGAPAGRAESDHAIFHRALDGGTVVIDDAGEVDLPPFAAGELASLVAVPMRTSGRIVGVLHAGSRVGRRFTADDVELLHLAAERVAIAVDRAELFDREHRIAETLQRGLLPDRLPELSGVQLAARYLPGSAEVEVGGDWYEVVPLPRGRMCAAVGDVVGRGIPAAAAMGQFRNAMRALALEGLSPARLLDRLCELSIGLGREFATATILELDPATGFVAYSSAGHPPALVLPPRGEPWFLEGGRSTPLGVEPGTAYPEGVAQIEPGTTILVYTDGLIERRGETLDQGLQRLYAAAAGVAGAERLVDVVVEALAADRLEDDVALLAIHYLAAPVRLDVGFPSLPSSVSRFRSATRVWLEDAGVGGEDVEDVVLAVSEACSNAVEHAGVTDGDVVLSAEFHHLDLVITVRDAGRWRPPHLRFERGRGLRVIRALMDEVQVSRRGDGTEVRMRRRLRERIPVA